MEQCFLESGEIRANTKLGTFVISGDGADGGKSSFLNVAFDRLSLPRERLSGGCHLYVLLKGIKAESPPAKIKG